LLITIITPCLNRAAFLAEAVESVRDQDYPHVEHIIMDGGSTDGSLELLGRYPHLRVYSQPDKGIYDALNKGIRLSQGDVIGFLNTDDCYAPGIFSMVAKAFTENPQIDAAGGGASIFSGIPHGERATLMEFPCVPQNELLARATLGAPVFNAWFFRTRLLHELEGFDLRYRYAADRDLLIRMAFRNISYASIDRTFYHYRMHPGSYTLSGQESGEAEFMFETRALAENYLHGKQFGSIERNTFKAWHSQIMMEQILTAVHKKAFHRAAGYLLIGLRHNLGLSFIFAQETINRIFAMVSGTVGRR
jgi:glycosyltransferase involved in cell wall biosynthesis